MDMKNLCLYKEKKYHKIGSTKLRLSTLCQMYHLCHMKIEALIWRQKKTHILGWWFFAKPLKKWIMCIHFKAGPQVRQPRNAVKLNPPCFAEAQSAKPSTGQVEAPLTPVLFGLLTHPYLPVAALNVLVKGIEKNCFIIVSKIILKAPPFFST